MPKQTMSQKIGSLGHSFVETQVKESEVWIARNLTEDFGIDLELEYAPDEVTGNFVKVQIKSHQLVVFNSDFVSESLDKSFLRYVYECRIPILLVVVCIHSKRSWYLWLQKWIVDSGNVKNIYDDSKTATLSVHIHFHQEFIRGLKGDIISIARWENLTQLSFAVSDLARLALRLNDETLSKLLFDYLPTIKSNNLSEHSYLDAIIEQVLELGSSIWGSSQGNNVSQMLYKFIRDNGQLITADHVAKIIFRGDSISRVGLNALGILYDKYPKHTLSLNLTEKFTVDKDQLANYYCAIRERFLGVESPMWMMKDDSDLKVGNLQPDFSSINTSLFDKWANRGESVILDYLIQVD